MTRYKAWIRNPYVLASIAGVIFVPAIRPFLRRIPDPPQRIREMPAFELRTVAGRRFTNQDVEGRVYAMSVARAHRPSGHKNLQAIARRYREMNVDFPVLYVLSAADKTEGTDSASRKKRLSHGLDADLIVLEGDAEDIESLSAALSVSLPASEKPKLNSVALIDGDGWLRGVYSLTPNGIDEAIHRSVHIDLAARADSHFP